MKSYRDHKGVFKMPSKSFCPFGIMSDIGYVLENPKLLVGNTSQYEKTVTLLSAQQSPYVSASKDEFESQTKGDHFYQY